MAHAPEARGWIAAGRRWAWFPAARRVVSRRATVPHLSLEVGAALEERLGVCVVCSESLSTIVMEPCGHLALCGSCHLHWSSRTNTCPLCRTPGTGVHMLSAPDNVAAVDVRLLDGRICVPSLEEGPPAPQPPLKLAQRRAMRALTRSARARVGSNSDEPQAAGGRQAVLLRAVQEEAAWARYEQRVRTWKTQTRALRAVMRTAKTGVDLDRATQALDSEYLYRSVASTLGRTFARRLLSGAERIEGLGKGVLRAVLKKVEARRPDVEPLSLRPGRRRGSLPVYSRHFRPTEGHLVRRHVAEAKRALRAATAERLRKRAETREERLEQARESLMVAEAAMSEAENMGSASMHCGACGVAEACMMELPCRHFTRCRACWEAEEDRSACAQCGSRCKVTLCVHRP